MKKIAEDLAAVVDFVRQNADGARSGEIARALKEVPQRTLQRWVKGLVEEGRLTQAAKGPAARYRLPRGSAEEQEEQKATKAPQALPGEEKPGEATVPLSAGSERIREYLRQPSASRKAVGHNRQFLDGYRPNTTFYLSLKLDSANFSARSGALVGQAEVGQFGSQIEPAVFERTKASNSGCIKHLDGRPNRNLPTDSAEEAEEQSIPACSPFDRSSGRS